MNYFQLIGFLLVSTFGFTQQGNEEIRMVDNLEIH